MNFQPISGYDVALDAIKAVGLPIRVKEIPEHTKGPAIGLPNEPAKCPMSSKPYYATSQLTKPTSHSSQDRLPESSTTPSASPYPWISSRPPIFDRDGDSGPVSTSDQYQSQSASPVKHIMKPSTSLPPSRSGASQLLTSNADQNYSTNYMSINNLSTNNLSTNAVSSRQKVPVNPMSSSDIFGIQPARAADLTSQELWTSGNSQQPTMNDRSQTHLRPTSAPEAQTTRIVSESLSLSQMLPPPRILPFPERKRPPLKRRSEEEVPSQGATESAEETVPKPKPKPKRKSRARTTVAKTTAISTENPKTPPRILAPKKIAKKPVSATIKKSAQKLPSASAPVKRSKIATKEPRPESLSPFDEETTTVASSPISHTAPRRSKVEIASNQAERIPNELATEPGKLPKGTLFNPGIQPEEFMASLDTWIRKYHNLPAPEAPKTSKDLLAAYAGQSDEERSQSIDNLICECLEDENFGKLVEDIEGAWKRITLGF